MQDKKLSRSKEFREGNEEKIEVLTLPSYRVKINKNGGLWGIDLMAINTLI